MQCSTVITRLILYIILTKCTHSSHVKAMYGVSFVNSNSDLYSDPAIATMYTLSCYIGLRRNGNKLYLVRHLFACSIVHHVASSINQVWSVIYNEQYVRIWYIRTIRNSETIANCKKTLQTEVMPITCILIVLSYISINIHIITYKTIYIYIYCYKSWL